ncbi:hypothetical protein M5K25_007360 [Dendrobium thyrsiflorum]|uniref:Replication protein A OB domain-containing protein n=1 Tax=Dendrobium thyrsiflorum TaxID=117978 RepID=A0ABD0VLC7_DENTH
MFNEIIDRFHDILQTGKTYVFSNGQIKEINKDFYNVNEKIEIILNNTSNIELSVTDNIDSPKIKLSVIEDIKGNPNLPSDIILLVVKVPEVRMIYRHTDKKKIVKRDLQVIDLRSEVCTFTLWETLAIVEGKQLEELRNEKTIILAKGVIGKYFNGFVLSTTTSTTIEINPTLPIIGMPVTELEKIQASSAEDYNNIIKNIFDKEMTFLVKAEDKIYGSRTFRSLTVQSVKKGSDEVCKLQQKKIKIEEI